MAGNSEALQAFEATARVSASNSSLAIKGILSATLLCVTAYILISLYEDVKNGNLSINRMLWFVVRIFILLTLSLFSLT